MKKITVPDIIKMKAEGAKIPVLTAYGFQMARILDSAGVPVLLVGDSAGMVEAGHENTLPVTMDEMVYHTRSVVRGRSSALVVADMPFGSYQVSMKEARKNAVRLVKEAGAEAVKIEGGVRSAETVRSIAAMDIPVMGHIGLTPQSIHRMGGYRVQGKGNSSEVIIDDARAIEDAGAFSVVLEGIPAALAAEITASLSIPTIGIGAGPSCDGQVLVVDDMLGLNTESRLPKYVKKYADLKSAIRAAALEFMDDVAEGRFPSKEQSY